MIRSSTVHVLYVLLSSFNLSVTGFGSTAHIRRAESSSQNGGTVCVCVCVCELFFVCDTQQVCVAKIAEKHRARSNTLFICVGLVLQNTFLLCWKEKKPKSTKQRVLRYVPTTSHNESFFFFFFFLITTTGGQ
jgi:hypothetical protein